MKTPARSFRYILACSGAMLLLQSHVFAQNIKVAIAANLQPVIKVLQADFKKQTNISIDVISGASGNLAMQIKNGAPFDVFLSADVAFPAQLYKVKFAAQAPVVYAQGILVICSTKKTGNASWAKIITSAKVKRIAIANPAIAPYGKAAEEALKHEGIYNQVKPKLITGESISQVNTYIATNAVEAGFTSLSFFKENSSKFPLVAQTIDPKIYAPIEQGMVILKHGQNNADAAKFYRYILSAPAKKIFVQYGYHVQ